MFPLWFEEKVMIQLLLQLRSLYVLPCRHFRCAGLSCRGRGDEEPPPPPTFSSSMVSAIALGNNTCIYTLCEIAPLRVKGLIGVHVGHDQKINCPPVQCMVVPAQLTTSTCRFFLYRARRGNLPPPLQKLQATHMSRSSSPCPRFSKVVPQYWEHALDEILELPHPSIL